MTVRLSENRKLRVLRKNSYKVNVLAALGTCSWSAICCYARREYLRRVLARGNICPELIEI